MPDNVIITINGQKQTDLEIDLLEVVVDTNLYLPGMFSITVHDEVDNQTGKLGYGDSEVFAVGAEVKVEVETDEIVDEPRPVKGTIIIGEITAVEPSFSADGIATLQVRGYDRSHRLTRGKKTRTYGDANPTGSGITEDRIVETIVRETEGITKSKIDTSGLNAVKYYYVMQYNQTDLEFLWARARALGYQVYVEDKTLCFQKADALRGQESDNPTPLLWPDNLSSFEPRLTLMHQVDQAVVKGWDPATKEPILGTNNSDASKTIPKIGLGQKGSALAKKALGGAAEAVVVDHPVRTVDQAKAMAAARFAEAESEFVRADGTCRQGDPRLVAGRVVTIEGVGERFSGDYYVTEAHHVYVNGSYRVTFSVTGRVPNTLSYLLYDDNGHHRASTPGVVTAKVTSLEDPEGLGRVQVMFPWLPKYKDADLSSNWARIATPMAGQERGFFFLPEIDDEVLVAFEHGDVNYPYIVGVLWNNTDKPPAGSKDTVLSSDKKKVDQRVIRSRSGHLIILDDTEGEEQIIIQDKTEKNSIVINSKENKMTISLEGDLTIVPKGQATIEASDAMTIKSTKDVSIECANFNVKANQNAKIEAMSNVDVKATANLTLQATAQGKLTGSAGVTVDSPATATIKGGVVMIN